MHAPAMKPCRLRLLPQEPAQPDGLVNIGGEWFYEEYTLGTGVRELAAEPEDLAPAAPEPTSPDEKKDILDMFGNGKPQ